MIGLTTLLMVLAAEPVLRVVSAEGEPVTAPLVSLGPDWQVRLATDPPHEVAGQQLISLAHPSQSRPELPDQAQIILTNGDRLAGFVTAVRDDEVIVQPSFQAQPPVALPLDVVSVIWLEAPDRSLTSEPRGSDVVILKNGDRLRGTLLSLGDQIEIQTDAAKPTLRVPTGRVRAIALSSDLAQSLEVRGQHGRVVLNDGSRLTLASANWREGVLEGTLVAGPKVRVPSDQVVVLDIVNGVAVDLAGLKPHSSETEPFFPVYQGVSSVVPARTKLDPATPMRLGGVVDRGLLMHSRSRLTYPLQGRYRRFEARVGLDDRMGQRGRVRIRVLVDGQPVDLGARADRDLTAGDEPLQVRVDLLKAKSLTLEVDYGRRGPLPHDEGNHVVWAEARLIRP